MDEIISIVEQVDQVIFSLSLIMKKLISHSAIRWRLWKFWIGLLYFSL